MILIKANHNSVILITDYYYTSLIYYKMGAGISVVDGNVEISKERMQKIYEKYSDPSAYNAWKKQLEDAAKKQEIYNKTNTIYAANIFMLKPETA